MGFGSQHMHNRDQPDKLSQANSIITTCQLILILSSYKIHRGEKLRRQRQMPILQSRLALQLAKIVHLNVLPVFLRIQSDCFAILANFMFGSPISQ